MDKDIVFGCMRDGKPIPLTESNVLEYIKKYRSYASFVDLCGSFEGAKGNLSFGYLDKNIVFGVNISQALSDILKKLLDGKKIVMKPTTPLTYFIDGCVPNLPVAKRDTTYKKLRWLPVTFV